jgi:tetratricopeptide (TPR) repeat protein
MPSGRIAEGSDLLEWAVAKAAATRLLFLHSLQTVWLGEAHLLGERPDDAMEHARRALDSATRRKERGHEAWALRLLGEIASCGSSLEVRKAEEQYGAAVTLAKQLGMSPLVAHCHLGLGKLYRRTGQREQAREHLTTATAMYREMDMRFWPEQAEAERTKLTSQPPRGRAMRNGGGRKPRSAGRHRTT